MNLDVLMDALKEDEGFQPLVYDDATGDSVVAGYTLVGHPTIGYGWNLATDPITESQAADILRRRTLQAYQDASALVRNYVLLNDVRQNVLANMAYNLGYHRLGTFKRMIAAVERKDFLAAAAEMEDSAWYRQVGKRAVRLTKEMMTGNIG